jgi:hypothetical protein
MGVPALARAKARTHTFPPPVRGWIRNENLAASGPVGAYQLDNFFPTTTGIRLRGGSRKHATISSGAATSLWTYKVGTSEKFFAADATNIFDVTTVADVDAIPAAAVSGQTSGRYAVAQMGTAGGDYLYAVNGDDSPQLFDGTTWTAITGVSSPAITGVTTSKLSFVWAFASRLFFVEKSSMNAWYLPVDSIGGAALSFSLNGIFQNGGELLYGGTWSLDSGDGLDDKCVFVSSTGEVAIYEGTDPGSASNWSKVGVYDITPPMGFNATMKAGGDLVLATEDGMVPITQAVQKDPAALSLSAITRAIEPQWKSEVTARRSKPWDVLKWPSNNMAVVALPVVDSATEAYCFVVNLETGAWCRYTGWDTECLGHFNSIGYFGTSDGKIMQMEAGGIDDGSPYTAVYVGLFDHLKAPGALKTVHAARPVFTSNSDVNPQISLSTNYAVSLPSPPNSIADYAADEWDVGLWDVANWDAGVTLVTKTEWTSIGRTGFAIAPQLQITSGVTPTPRVNLVTIDMLYETGAVMV